jgi:hypothetical protein
MAFLSGMAFFLLVVFIIVMVKALWEYSSETEHQDAKDFWLFSARKINKLSEAVSLKTRETIDKLENEIIFDDNIEE